MNMFKRKNGVLAFLLVAVMLLGVGFAALSDDLAISGSAAAVVEGEEGTTTPAEQLFDESIGFTAAEVGTCSTGVTITPDATTYSYVDAVSFTATGFVKEGDTAKVTYTISNKHPDLGAEIPVPAVTNANPTYFNVTTDWGTGAKQIAAVNGSTTVTVTVELIKAPIADQTASIDIEFTGIDPVQP